MRSHRFMLVIALVVFAPIWYASTASAQTTANGPYYAIPSWDQTLTIANRFVVLLNMNSDAVLDRETGLVWQRAPSTTVNNNHRASAHVNCLLATTGGRQGWRLPRADELMSLADPTNSNPGVDHLPAGHPFNLPSNAIYWSSDRIPADIADGGITVLFFTASPGAIINTVTSFSVTGARAWCVRGSGGIGGR